MNRDYDDDPGNDYSRDNDEYNPIELERDIADSDPEYDQDDSPYEEPEQQEEPDCDVFDREDDSSSFESIGWGTDEDYGYYGENAW
tara:strand:+ start:523 stop:780 length:258 start_codon:yes stop_codon:yes gene_type:complete